MGLWSEREGFIPPSIGPIARIVRLLCSPVAAFSCVLAKFSSMSNRMQAERKGQGNLFSQLIIFLRHWRKVAYGYSLHPFSKSVEVADHRFDNIVSIHFLPTLRIVGLREISAAIPRFGSGLLEYSRRKRYPLLSGRKAEVEHPMIRF